MALSDAGSLYKVKFCVHNHIYEEILSAELFEDMRVNGLRSQVVHEIRQEEAKSVAIGKFKHPVELLSIHPHIEKLFSFFFLFFLPSDTTGTGHVFQPLLKMD